MNNMDQIDDLASFAMQENMARVSHEGLFSPISLRTFDHNEIASPGDVIMSIERSELVDNEAILPGAPGSSFQLPLPAYELSTLSYMSTGDMRRAVDYNVGPMYQSFGGGPQAMMQSSGPSSGHFWHESPGMNVGQSSSAVNGFNADTVFQFGLTTPGSSTGRSAKSEELTTQVISPEPVKAKRGRRKKDAPQMTAEEAAAAKEMFLERNRAAAAKCREKKKYREFDMKFTVETLRTEYNQAVLMCGDLKDQLNLMKEQLRLHRSKCQLGDALNKILDDDEICLIHRRLPTYKDPRQYEKGKSLLEVSNEHRVGFGLQPVTMGHNLAAGMHNHAVAGGVGLEAQQDHLFDQGTASGDFCQVLGSESEDPIVPSSTTIFLQKNFAKIVRWHDVHVRQRLRMITIPCLSQSSDETVAMVGSLPVFRISCFLDLMIRGHFLWVCTTKRCFWLVMLT